MVFSDTHEQKALHKLRNISAALVPGLVLAGCGGPVSAPAAQGATSRCVPDGELRVNVYGSLEGRLDWRGSELVCEGMPRPHGRGARLRFEGPATGDSSAGRLAFIIALPDLAEGQTATELSAGVTLMEVDAGRFFSSPEQAGCWADIARQEPVGDAVAVDHGDYGGYRISGILYCVSPLAEVNGTASVSLRDLRFTGMVDWREPQ